MKLCVIQLYGWCGLQSFVAWCVQCKVGFDLQFSRRTATSASRFSSFRISWPTLSGRKTQQGRYQRNYYFLLLLYWPVAYTYKVPAKYHFYLAGDFPHQPVHSCPMMPFGNCYCLTSVLQSDPNKISMQRSEHFWSCFRPWLIECWNFPQLT